MFSVNETEEVLNAIKKAQRLANQTGKTYALVNTRHGLDVYPYSTSYVRFKRVLEIITAGV
jgi:hypothetical protein